jgi:putative peptidoglycan lipid II flippase
MIPPVARIVRMVALSAVARGPGALFPAVLAMFFGASETTDAFLLGFNALWMAGIGIGLSLEATAVPHAAINLREGARAAARFAAQATRNALVLSGLSVVFGAAFLWVGLAIAGWRGPSTTVFGMYALLAPTGVAACVSGVYSGCLAAGWKLESTIISNSFRGLGALAGAIVGGSMLQIWPVALGLFVGETARAWWLRQRWTRLLGERATQADTGEGGEGTFRRDMLYQAGTNVILCVPPLVDRILAGPIGVAAISRVDYAYRTAMLATILFEGGIAPWLLAQWANLRSRGELASTWREVYRPIAAAAGAAVCLGLGVFVAAPLIVQILLEHGRFRASDAVVVTELLRWYGLGLILNMTALCFERLLLARSSNRAYFLACMPRVAVRISVVMALLPSLGLLALPAAFVAAEAIYLGLLVFVTSSRGAAR